MHMVWTEILWCSLDTRSQQKKTSSFSETDLNFIIFLFIDGFSCKLPVHDKAIIYVTPLQINSPGGKVPVFASFKSTGLYFTYQSTLDLFL